MQKGKADINKTDFHKPVVDNRTAERKPQL
jgi:hypothetical protein